MSIIASQYITGRKIIVRVHPMLYKDCKLRSVYNICTMGPAEEFTASLASTYLLTVLVAEVLAFLSEGAYGLCVVVNSEAVAALASVYDLSTEAP